ncbi:MAG: TRAP transporter substrate-binding protein [Rhodospirillales bacterium]
MQKYPRLPEAAGANAVEAAPASQSPAADVSRRTLLSVAGTTLVAAPFIRVRPAEAAEFTYKYANNLSPSHPMNQRAAQAADRIKTETNGRVQIDIFPKGELGSDTSMLSQLRSGAVEFFTLSGAILSILVPEASINGIGFAFADYDAVWRAMDGDLGAYIRAQIAKTDLIAMDRIWDNGFRQITSSSKPIVTPEDLHGFQIRVPVGQLWISMFRSFDAAPISLNFVEVYSALRNRLVEGQENPLAIIATAKLYEVQKYCSLTNHMWDGFWFLANRAAWDRLPVELQEVVARNWNDAALAERADLAQLSTSLKTDLPARGLVFNQPDPAPFRETLRRAGFYSEWRHRYGEEAWGLLEATTGQLG